jgi:hypothetical protein
MADLMTFFPSLSCCFSALQFCFLKKILKIEKKQNLRREVTRSFFLVSAQNGRPGDA